MIENMSNRHKMHRVDVNLMSINHHFSLTISVETFEIKLISLEKIKSV